MLLQRLRRTTKQLKVKTIKNMLVQPTSSCALLFSCLAISVAVRVPPVSAEAETPAKTCPHFCKCQLQNEHNLADCSGKRLVQANVAVPVEVELLDLSFNDITTLENTCFQSYSFLLNLTVAHNAIHTIYLDVFRQLRRLRDVDLSYNRLEYLDSRLFESNRRLHTLNLAGNKFMSLPEKPLLHSGSLRTLNLANSLMDAALADHYSALPQLQQLDLSRNLIITVDQLARHPPAQLVALNLNENNLVCDRSLRRAIELLQQRNIAVAYSNCDVGAHDADAQQFERIEQLASGTEADEGDSSERIEESVEESFTWHRPTIDAAYDDNEYSDYYDLDDGQGAAALQQLFKQQISNESCLRWCQQQLRSASRTPAHAPALDTAHAPLYSKIDLLFIFVCGVAAGVGVTIFIGTCVLCILRCTDVHKSHTHSAADSDVIAIAVPRSHFPTSTAPAAPATATELLPVPVSSRRMRHSRRAAAQPEQRALVRSDQLGPPARDSFITRLLGRPARHQYYRTINANTATLIRRLSRSNLFTNRQSQHFGDSERQNAPSTPSSPDAQDADDELAALSTRSTATSGSQTDRPETPPPHYSEIVAKCDNANRD